MMERQNQYDHPHRIALRKEQLVHHVQQHHPFGSSVTPEKELKRWAVAELKDLHRQLHDGFEDGGEDIGEGSSSSILETLSRPTSGTERLNEDGSRTVTFEYDEMPGKLSVVFGSRR